MAVTSKKDKLTEEAQKHVVRGQLDKAIRTYEQILELDPTATNLRQKLAELLIKCGRNEEARKELEVIGRNFAKNGFYLKSIAVCKQLQKLFPADISISLELAELNGKHGLAANAATEYKLVYEFYEKSGNSAESLRILEKMQNVDPQNLSVTVKLAESYTKAGKTSEAAGLFSKTASLFLDRGDNASLARMCSSAKVLLPDKPDFLLETIGSLINKANAATFVETLQIILRSNPDNKPAWDLIAQAYQLLGQPQRAKAAFQHYLKFFPTEPSAIIGFISSVAAEGNLASALDLLDRHRNDLNTATALPQLEQLYQLLEKTAPENQRVLDGLGRIAIAAGNKDKAVSFATTQQSVGIASGSMPENISAPLPAEPIDVNQPQNHEVAELPSCFQSYATDLTTDLANTKLENNFQFETLEELAEEDLETEIEIEIDDDSQFDALYQSAGSTSTNENLTDYTGDLFDTISTNPCGVKFGNEMDSSDAQSHFDLGQAFKEMGLLDEAINEFRQSAKDPSRRIECLTMQCACLRERGDAEKAISMLLTLLKSELSNEEACAVKYELAAGYEATGKKEEANLIIREIQTASPGFRDISSRLNDQYLPDTLDFSDDDLKDF